VSNGRSYDDGLIAVHESGHAFMAVALGLPLRRVQVGDDPSYDLVAAPTHPRRDLVRILMAGGAAETVIFGAEPVGTRADDEEIAALLDQGDNEPTLRNKVRRLIELNAGTVKYLASRLARAGVLSGSEVRAIVRGQFYQPR
jgi:hypothetical protein